jgi:sec-independent protein translocase protein TatB
MPSLQDSAVIFLIALLLFGPKKLPELARYVGKLMNEFRRASNEFRMQMEDEFRQAEQVEHQKKVAAIEATAPVPSTIAAETIPAEAAADNPDPENARPFGDSEPAIEVATQPQGEIPPSTEPVPEPVPIASNGDLHLMPPSTGLPISRSLSSFFDNIPAAPDPAIAHESETHHG